MRRRVFRIHSSLLRSALRSAFGVAALLATVGVHAQSLRVTAADAGNSQVYDVTFLGTGGSTTPLNTDQNLYVGLSSLVFIANASTGKVDLLVADASRGVIVRYAGAAGAATVIWSTTQGPGPVHPDGLSVSSDGDLFVVSSARGDHNRAEAWVLPHDPAVPLGAGFRAPLLVDSSFGGVSVQSLAETVVARTTSAAAGPGDLLVLASDPATVFVYSAVSLRSVLAGGGPVSPARTLLGPGQLPAGAFPGGMDFWPVDNSLLIATVDGTILRYSFTATSATRLPDFSSGLGNGKFRIKTGIEDGVPYAFVANDPGSDILKFGAPPVEGDHNPPLATVTSGVQRPQGLATTNLAASAASACLQSLGGCDLLGNVIKHNVRGVSTLGGFIIEDVCVVPVDPRVAQFGTCTRHSLPVAQVCAGYGDTVIPDTLCGGSGSSGSGFALVKSLTNTVDQTKGALIWNDARASSVLIGSAPPCPQTALAWAPLAAEGTIVEGNALLELTGTCGTSGGVTRGMSIWGLGLVVNTSALPGKKVRDKWVNFAYSKYHSLFDTIALASINPAFQRVLASCVATSRMYVANSQFSHAAAQLLTCDSLVAGNESSFSGTDANPNPSGEIRGRLANLYLTINTRILGNVAPSAWPPP
jgi:hypothetical protein